MHDGKLFFNTGAVYDATTGTRIGQYSFFGPYGPGPIIDGPTKRALVVTRGVSEQQISTFDIDTLKATGGSLVRASIGNLTEMLRWSADSIALAGTTGVTLFKTDLFGRPPDELKIVRAVLNGETLTLRFSIPSPGFYGLMETSELGGEPVVVGNALFRETTVEFPITTSGAQKFYRLARFQ